jgi:hypothetical protein
MLIEIKNRFTGSVIFSHEQEGNSLRITLDFAIKSEANLSGADLSGANLSRADLSGANLSEAYLSEADLSGAYLSGAYLSRADLSEANLSGANLSEAYLSRADLSEANLKEAKYGMATLKNGLLQLLGKYWPIYIFDAHIKIGCQFHSTEDWESFNDEQIADMDGSALPFWKENKDLILTLANHHQKQD